LRQKVLFYYVILKIPNNVLEAIAVNDMNEMPGMENAGGTGDESGATPSTGGAGTESGEMAYCVKCRKKTAMVETQKVTMKNGRPALSGKCGVCGTGMYKILSQKK
jgi:hypothetical protein